jgi:cytoskeletal protein CcmA (bactofilin family)
VVGGIIRGAIIASEKVVILSSAVVIGSISSPRLIAEEGVILEGTINISGVPVSSVPGQNSGADKRGWFGVKLFGQSADGVSGQKVPV